MGVDLLAVVGAPATTATGPRATSSGEAFGEALDLATDVEDGSTGEADLEEEEEEEPGIEGAELEGAIDEALLDLEEPAAEDEAVVGWSVALGASPTIPEERAPPAGTEAARPAIHATVAPVAPAPTASASGSAATPGPTGSLAGRTREPPPDLTPLAEPVSLARGPRVVDLTRGDRPLPEPPARLDEAAPGDEQPAEKAAATADPADPAPRPAEAPARARRPRRLESVKQQLAPRVDAVAPDAEPELTPEQRIEALPTAAELDLPAETPEGLVALPRALRVELDDELAVEIASEGAEVDVRLEGTVRALEEQAGLQPELDERLGREGWSLEHYEERARERDEVRPGKTAREEPVPEEPEPEPDLAGSAREATVSTLA